MSEDDRASRRIVKAVHGRQEATPDAPFELGLAEYLKAEYGADQLLELYQRFGSGVAASST